MPACNRRQFNALLLAGAAGSLLPACGSPLAATVTPQNGQALLTYAQFPALQKAGGSVAVAITNASPIIVVRTSDTAAAALSATCTHAACIVGFDAATGEIHCACHNADFDLATGAVLRGPPPVALPTYAASVGSDAITVQLT